MEGDRLNPQLAGGGIVNDEIASLKQENMRLNDEIATLKQEIAGIKQTVTSHTHKLTLTGAATGTATLGSSETSLPIARRHCIVGNKQQIKTWSKFASVASGNNYDDPYIAFLVDTGDFNMTTGILTAHMRTVMPPTNPPTVHLRWVVAPTVNFDATRFVGLWKIADGKANLELWCYSTEYVCYHFTVLSEGNRTTFIDNLWTLYNSTSNSIASLPTGYTQVNSVVA